MLFSNEEKRDMLEIYYASHRNVQISSETYLRRYPERQQPCKSYFLLLHRNLGEHGSFCKPRRKYENRVHENEEEILERIRNNRFASTREIAEELNLSRQVVWRVLKKHKYRAYKIHISQALHPGDENRRMIFCRFVMNQLEQDPNFLNNVIFTDECKFTNLGLFNRHNEHVWSIENPRRYQERRPQVRFGVNVWVGLLGNTVIGPYIYEENLTSDMYLHFLRTFLTDYVDNDICLNRLNNIWYQQDGAPPHNTRRVYDCLSELFPGKVISNNGDIQWPARSPDISPLDYYLWGTMKNLIYKTVPADVDELRRNIITVLRTKIRRRDITRALQNLRKRIELCLEVGGGQFEHLL